MPDPSTLATIATSAIPSIGSIGAAALQRNWALKDWNRVNAYNHPKEQVSRLRQAGLPLASMFSGSGGSTSSAPNTPSIDPTLGTAKGLDSYFTNQLTRKQVQLLDEQIGKAEADKVISQVAANKARDEDTYYREALHDENGWLRLGNRRRDSLDLSMREQVAKTKTSEILADLQGAKTQADIDHILSTIALGKQQIAYNEAMQLIDKITIQKMQDNGGISGIEALLYNFFIKKGSLVPR